MCEHFWNQGPREKLALCEPSRLTSVELVALLLGTGTRWLGVLELSQNLLETVGGPAGLLGKSMRGLTRIEGVGEAKAARLLAGVELGVRSYAQLEERKTKLSRPEDVFDAYRLRLAPLRQEVIIAIGLSGRDEVISDQTVAKGALSGCCVEPREIFRPLVESAARRALVVHNHPSGDPTPSAEDIALTRRLAEAGDLLGIPLVDHVIVGRQGYSSLRELGVFR